MKIAVRFTGPLRSLAGCSSLELSLEDGATLRDALLALRDQVPHSFAEQVVVPLGEGDPPLALLLLNGAHLSGPAELDRPLVEGGRVAFVTPMAGG